MTTSLPVMALPPDSPPCFACGMACEAVSHAWRDRLPRTGPAAPAGASKIKYNHQEPYSIGGWNSKENDYENQLVAQSSGGGGGASDEIPVRRTEPMERKARFNRGAN